MTALDDAYAACRRVNAVHGRTFYAATLLLPRDRRRSVHALYAFARHADDIVDGARSRDERAAEIDELKRAFQAGDTSSPILAAVHDTLRRRDVPLQYVESFLASMRQDLDVTDYATWDDLVGYMYGSAAVIGLQLLPVLGTVPGMAEVAAPYAEDLGYAFQLTNFIRDVGEDLARGRLYLPKEDLAAFGVDRANLEAGIIDGNVRALLAFEITRARELFRDAKPGIRLLDPASRDCVETAFTLYAGILDEVERADYRVLDRRVAVGLTRRAAVALPALRRARRARRPHHTHHAQV